MFSRIRDVFGSPQVSLLSDRMLIGAALLALATAVGGCGSTSSNPERQPTEPALKRAPNVQVQSLSGSSVNLASAWAEGRAAVIFYRGHW